MNRYSVWSRSTPAQADSAPDTGDRNSTAREAVVARDVAAHSSAGPAEHAADGAGQQQDLVAHADQRAHDHEAGKTIHVTLFCCVARFVNFVSRAL